MRSLIFSLCIGLLFFSCEDENEKKTGLLQSTRILNDERSALSARVSATFSASSYASIEYWEEGNTESVKTLSSSVSTKIHKFSLTGLKEKTTYRFHFKNGQHEVVGQESSFTTAAIPDAVKTFYKESENEIEDESNGYYLFHNLAKPGIIYLVDHTGKIAWYRTTPNMIKSARFTEAKTLITLQDDNDNPLGDANVLLETTLAGDTLMALRLGDKGFDQMAHHDAQRRSNGHLVVVTNVNRENAVGDGLIVLNRQGQKVWDWNTFQEFPEIDLATYKQPWLNSLTIDTDGNYIASFRSLCQVWKINATTGVVMWKLGKNGNVEHDEEGEFLFQHFAHRNKSGDIMLFDNGSADRPSSRALSFSINETTKEATVKVNTTLPTEFYSMIMGSAMFLPDNNILAASAVHGRILKMNSSGEVLWSLKTDKQIFRVFYLENPF